MVRSRDMLSGVYAVVFVYFGVEKATCFKWLQNASFKESWPLRVENILLGQMASH